MSSSVSSLGCATNASPPPDTTNLPPEEARPRPRGSNGAFLAVLTSPAYFCAVDFSDIAPTMVLSGRVRLTGQNIVISIGDSYHPIASWAEFIHAMYFGQAVKKVPDPSIAGGVSQSGRGEEPE
jgi:hypothetical protein